jgi:hypothetical protein
VKVSLQEGRAEVRIERLKVEFRSVVDVVVVVCEM